MHCLYCRHRNPDDEPRCQRCARRLEASPARSAPDNYVGAYSAAATAVAPVMERAPVAVETAPQRVQVPHQARLFSDLESGKVLQFPSVAKAPEPKQRPRRQAAEASDNQAFLD